MKNCKKILAIILAIAMVFCSIPLVFAVDENSENHVHTYGYKKTLFPAYCETVGEGGVFCAICNEMYDTYEIPALGHTNIDVTSSVSHSDVDIVFTIDVSESMLWSDPSAVRCEVANNVVDRMDKEDKGAVVAFDHQVYLNCDMTDDKDAIKQGINKTNVYHGGTDIYGALMESFSLFDSTSISGKYIILLTDGEDNGYTQFDYEQMSKDTNASVLTVGLGSLVNETELTEIADKTGGKYYHASNANDLYEIYDTIIEEIIVNKGGAWVTTKQPTATQNGEMVCFCTRCGKALESKEVPATHTSEDHVFGYKKTLFPAYCETVGEGGIFCAICDKMYDTYEIPALGHTGTSVTSSVSHSKVDVVFAIDVSGSMSWSDPTAIRCEVATNVVDRMDKDDKGAVVAFDDDVYVYCNMTDDKDTIRQAIDKTNQDLGGTNMYGALSQSFTMFDAASNAGKYIILITDGEDNCYEYFDYEQQAKDTNSSVYTVGLGDSVNESELTEIADKTGGKYYHASNANDLYEIYDTIIGEIITNKGGAWVTTKQPTATQNGEMVCFCTRCGKALGSKEITLTHTYNDHIFGYKKTLIPAYCETVGEGGVFCAICNEMYETYEIPALGHTGTTVTGTTSYSNVDVVLTIDISGSMSSSDPTDIRCEVANNVVDRMDNGDRAAVVAFDDDVYVLCDMTDDTDLLRQAIDQASKELGSTNMYGALSQSFSMFDATSTSGKYVILITDGEDNCYEYFDYEQTAKDTNSSVYTVGLGSYLNEAELMEIADKTGGKYYHATNANDLYEIYDTIIGEIITSKGGAWVTTKQPTATQNGEMVCFCTRCGKALASKEVTPTHTYKDHVFGYKKTLTPAYCETVGEGGVFCAICNEMYETYEIPALGHTGSSVTSSVSHSTVDVVFAIDVSGSMSSNDPTAIRCEVANNVVDRMDSGDRAAVIAFDNNVYVYCDMTSDKALLKQNIDKAAIDGGTTNMYGALSKSFSMFESTSTAGKYVILLTDGIDNCYNYCDYEQMSKDTNSSVYTVGLGSSIYESELMEIADKTGGKYFHASNADDLYAIYDTIIDEIIINKGGAWVTTKQPTCSQSGEMVCFCTRCGKALASKEVTSSHTYYDGLYINEECHSMICADCGQSATMFHEWSDWEYNSDNGFFSDGTKTRYCTGCMKVQTENANHSSSIESFFYRIYNMFLNLFRRLSFFK